MRDWEQIRADRDDLTDYVIHFTKNRFKVPKFALARNVLVEILKSGFIQPSFAMLPSRHSRTEKPTVKGPYPVVCLTEQPISAVLKTNNSRYSNYGIAYHKVPLYDAGGRPVLYGTERELGKKIQNCPEGVEIYEGGLPPELQYLWVRYHPLMVGDRNDYPVDFTWEREWRIKPPVNGLPILLATDRLRPPTGVIIVQRDDDLVPFSEGIASLVENGHKWPIHLRRIISLETAARKLDQEDMRYARIETWPFEEAELEPIPESVKISGLPPLPRPGPLDFSI
jgi:hypothetical protein